jgi:hypothetical protein
VQFAQIKMMQRVEIGQPGIFRYRCRRLRENGDHAKPQVGTAADQTMHPCGDASGHVGVGSLHDKADVGLAIFSLPARAVGKIVGG